MPHPRTMLSLGSRRMLGLAKGVCCIYEDIMTHRAKYTAPMMRRAMMTTAKKIPKPVPM